MLVLVSVLTDHFQRYAMLNATDGSEDKLIRLPGIDDYGLDVRDSDF